MWGVQATDAAPDLYLLRCVFAQVGKMSRTVRKWLRGLIAAGINGGLGSLTAMGFAPTEINFDNGLLKFCGVFTVSAVLGALTYLKDHALPDDEDIEDDAREAIQAVLERKRKRLAENHPDARL